MRILICSDGHALAENAIRFIAKTTAACSAEVTLLGVIERPKDEASLGEALGRGARILRDEGVRVEILTAKGHPIEQIKRRTLDADYDLVVVGAERKTRSVFALSTKAYHIIKGIDPPVLLVIGSRPDLRRILICSGGQPSMDRMIELTAAIAQGSRAEVALVHVLAAPPLIYSDLLEREILGVDKLLASNFSLAKNLRHEKAAFERLQVSVEVKLRCGDIADELLREARTRDCDLIVAGSAPTGGLLRTYVMGDVTAAILDGADRAVLVVRNATVASPESRLIRLFRRLFRAWKSQPPT